MSDQGILVIVGRRTVFHVELSHLQLQLDHKVLGANIK